jgi:acetyl esterase/lipase
VWVSVGLAVALAIAVPLVVIAWGRDSTTEKSTPRRTTTTATTATTAPPTTPTTAGPQTVPVPPTPPPPPTMGPPSAITVPTTAPPTTPDTTPRTMPRTTPDPTVTAAPGSTTSRPGPTSTTKPGRVTRRTVVFSPPGAPKRQATLVLPRQHENTIVVLVHPDAEDGSRKQVRGWANSYAQRGYPSLAIDYTRTVPLGPTYPKPQTDVKAAVQYLRERAGQLQIDPERIVVQGFEAGAALGAQAEVTPDDPFFDGTGHYPGVSDKPAAFIGFYGRYDGEQRNPTRYYGGPPDSPDPQVQARYAEANSIAQAANAAGPVLLVQGGGDAAEFVESATQFRDALESAGKDVTLTLVPEANSAFDQDTSGALTPEGREIAAEVLAWLAARFPPR